MKKEIKIICLTQGMRAVVDSDDFERVKKYKWVLCGLKNRRYVTATKNKKHLYLHRLIMNPKKGEYVDHINNDTFDNRKSNLRICTNSQNMMNQKKTDSKTSSKYRGVSRNKRFGKWTATISINKNQIFLGNFSSEKEAAIAYDLAAEKLYGSFALPNKKSHPELLNIIIKKRMLDSFDLILRANGLKVPQITKYGFEKFSIGETKSFNVLSKRQALGIISAAFGYGKRKNMKFSSSRAASQTVLSLTRIK